MTDPGFDLERFVKVQEPVFDGVLRELRAGQKRTHWMWFVFPQLSALGQSPTAKVYGISGLAEARAYLGHPVLGPRLVEATRTVLNLHGRSLGQVFGSPDDLKFRSCMTLFAAAAQGREKVFENALEAYCGGVGDERTNVLIRDD